MAVCEFRKVKAFKEGRVRVVCNCNGLLCQVDDGDSQHCLRFTWVKKVQKKTAELVKIQDELNRLALEGTPDA